MEPIGKRSIITYALCLAGCLKTQALDRCNLYLLHLFGREMTRYRFAYLYVYLFRYCWELSFLFDSKTLLCGADDCNYMWEKGGEGDNNKKERMKRLEWNVRTQLRDPGSLAVYCFSHPFFFYSFRYAYPFLIFPFCFFAGPLFQRGHLSVFE